MKRPLAWLALALLAAGCVESTVVPPPAAPRSATIDMCRHPWPYYVDERARRAEGDDVVLDLLVVSGTAPSDLSAVTYSLTWGRAPGHAETAMGLLSDLARGGGAWTLHDEDGDGALGRGDAFTGRVVGAGAADAHWHLLLWDERGAFLGGAPHCI